MATTYTESFESNFGSWTNITQFSTTGWARRTGSTPSGSTGPSAAHSGSYYIYVETSSGSSYTSGNTDIIQYNLPSSETEGNITFRYHQYGLDQGTLYLEAYTNSWNTLWSSSGDQGNQWNTVSNESFSGATAIRFRNVAAGGYRGDVALDNITVYSEEPTSNTIFWGTSAPSKINWGNSLVNKMYFGSTLFYENQAPTSWTYIGTGTMSYNSTTSAQYTSSPFCPANSVQISLAATQMSTFTPSNYSSGHIFRVRVGAGSSFPDTFCSYRYYRAD